MVCIYCRSTTQVTNSRLQKRRNSVWRRRKCLNCGAIFTTTEVAELIQALSVRTNKHFEPFSRDKLFVSLYDSLRHRKTALADAAELTDTIVEQTLTVCQAGAVERDTLVTVAAAVLERFDSVAVTHYVAFHPIKITNH